MVLFQTCPLTLISSPVKTSGTISHRTSLDATSGSTGPHGGESKSAPFCSVMVQWVPLAVRKGESAPAAIPESASGVPSQRIGYDFPRLASSNAIPALAREGAWKSARQAPKDEPVNWVASQK